MSERYLSGAFSPFTIALHNIRDNLLSKKDSKDIRYAYLQEIITLSIPIHTETKGGSTALEFPVAACWKNKLEDDVIFRYAGQYIPRDRGDSKDHGDSKETKERIKKAQLITPKILKKINEEKMRRFKGPEIVYENTKRPFAGSVTDYPESLRKIKGCWKLDCDDLRFLVFFTYASDLSENSTDKDERKVSYSNFMVKLKNLNFKKNKCCNINKLFFKQINLPWNLNRIQRKRIKKLFKSCFLAVDAYRYLSRITDIKSNNHNKDEKKDKKGYPVLRDLLSNIQRTIDIIAKPDKGNCENSTRVEELSSEHELSKIFGVVFVLPTIMDQDDKVGFRYILTHRQIRFFEEPGAAERIDSLIRGKEKKVLQKLWESHKNCCPNIRIKADCFGEDSSKQLKIMINNLRDNLNYDGYGKINKHKRGEVKELLRKAIYAYYAFAPKTKTELNHEMFGGGIAEYIESDRGTVQHDQAFLIRHIFNSRSPDVVENFINHPRTKLWKPTDRLIDQMEDDGLYPRALHLLETIFFPKRFFMYPLYQHETPVLLCAFNADSYLESRQSLKSILDRHIQGIFSAILNYELVRANKSFASMTSWSDTEAIGQFKQKLRLLLLRFCPEIEKIENIELGVKNAPDFPFVVVENNGREYNVGIPKLATIEIPLKADTEQLVTASPDGKQVLHHYLKLYAEAFARFREIADLSRSEEAHHWAHSMIARINIMSGYVNRFLLSPYQDLKAGIALFKKNLDILSRHDWAGHKNPVKTLFEQIEYLTENHWPSLDFGINLKILKGMIGDLNLQLDSLKKFHSYSPDDIDRAYVESVRRTELFEVIGVAMYYSLFRMLISTHVDYVNACKRILKTPDDKVKLLRALASQGTEDNPWEYINEFTKTNTNIQLIISDSIQHELKIPAIHSEIYIMLVEELLLNALKYGEDISAILKLDRQLAATETGFVDFKICNRIVGQHNNMGQGVGIVFRTARKYKPDFTKGDFTKESNGRLERTLPIKVKH